MPLIVWVTLPPRPTQNVFWCKCSLTRSGSSADWPITSGRKTSSAANTSPSLVKTEPHPLTPSSVSTNTSVWMQSSSFNSSLQPPSGVAPRRPTALIS